MLLIKLSEENKKHYLNLSLCLAKADGIFSDSEKKLIDAQCAEMGIGNNNYNEELSCKDVCDKIKNTATNAEKKIMFMELVSLALVDEEFVEEEKAFVEQVRGLLDIPEEVSEQAIDIISNIIKYTKTLENFIEW